MLEVVRAESIRVFRASTVAWTAGLLAGASALVCAGQVALAAGEGETGSDNVQVSTTLTLDHVAQATGFLGVYEPVGALIAPMVALVAAALFVGAPFRGGVVRLLLVQQPRRMRLLGGTLITVALLVALALLVAVNAGLASSAVVASLRGINVWPWFGAEGMAALAVFLGNSGIAALTWGCIAAVITVLTRSSAAGIGISLGWVAVENMLGGLWPGWAQYLPAALSTSVGSGGTTSVPYATALTITLLYIAVLLAATLAVFRYRDVVD